MLSTVYMLCNSLLFTPDRKTLQSTQNIQENHKEEFTWTKNVYTCIHVPEYLRLMISSLNKIRHQFFFSHSINYLVNLLIAFFPHLKIVTCIHIVSVTLKPTITVHISMCGFMIIRLELNLLKIIDITFKLKSILVIVSAMRKPFGILT